MSEAQKKKLFAIQAQLLEAQKEIQHVEKSNHNPMGFDYTSIDSMVRAARQVLHNNGLVLSCKGWSIHQTDDGRRIMVGKYELVHPESGGTEVYETSIPYPAEGRAEDKQYLGRQSSALKYFLRDLLMLPMLDNNEICAEIDKPEAKKTSKKAARKVPAKDEAKQDLLEAVTAKFGVTGKAAIDMTMSILEKLNLPVDGTATEKHLRDALAHVRGIE